MVVGGLWTIIITPFLQLFVPGGFADGPAMGDLYDVTLSVLFWVIVLGIGWEFVYHGLQQFRWEKDWPTMFGLLTGINEGILVFIVVNGEPFNLFGTTEFNERVLAHHIEVDAFAVHFITTWMIVWLFVNGPIRVITLGIATGAGASSGRRGRGVGDWRAGVHPGDGAVARFGDCIIVVLPDDDAQREAVTELLALARQAAAAGVAATSAASPGSWPTVPRPSCRRSVPLRRSTTGWRCSFVGTSVSVSGRGRIRSCSRAGMPSRGSIASSIPSSTRQSSR